LSFRYRFKILYEHSRMEAGYNTSTVAQRVIKGDEIGTIYWATLSRGDINTEIWSSGLGVGRKTDNLAL
jgi:hypothetical protein